ncbi:hypothetical protein CHCC14820_3334 [Bacillus paralicheniformis]|uniref:Thiosulfate sulfurtransferase rhodanese n=1 Tax=Bacillus paralicheniformis TaxID=1648923 RepID=A0A6I7TR62_9BACI|nr:hypothetical protein SC10_B2orf00475 [Bacillus paralicheniformis]OLF93714.1 Thiosulfate sulfurtransferase rhodanese [Bacillus paralicheniformis]OLG01605.1 Thiosulfate sulfurtransferase rhodanese [Bacillus paralicheniformis]TWJ81427.1 hypothetical protein CHCC20497_4514 [Bacillus paralicheniformis]TWK30915.1 hypothetical protein CHCC20372_2847 [Bacillus paralicheniformis]
MTISGFIFDIPLERKLFFYYQNPRKNKGERRDRIVSIEKP